MEVAMTFGLVLSLIVMLAFAGWGLYLRIHHVQETEADQEGWYESRIGFFAGRDISSP
jgi:hypothetical protein